MRGNYILYSIENKWNTVIPKEMGEFHRHNVEEKKPNIE